jgi:uncharacterized protein YndB with AHSA1/START domain
MVSNSPEHEPKAMARRLRTALADRDITVSHSEALELVARQLGARDWNTFRAAAAATSRLNASAHGAVDGHVVPILRVFDEVQALEFYVDYLEFTVDWRNETGGHEPLYAQLSRGEARVRLSGHHGDASPGSGVLVPITDALELQQALKAKAYPYPDPGIEDLSWGRVIPVVDPFSNRIVFYEAGGDTAPDVEPRPTDAAAPIVLRIWVDCSVQEAFEVFTTRIGEWWDPAYAMKDLRDVRIEPRVGGAVVMEYDGGVTTFGEVLVLDPPRHYAQSFTLTLDPQFPSRVDVTFTDSPEGGGTSVVFAHGGWTPGNVAGRSRFTEWYVLLGKFAAVANRIGSSSS